MDLRNNLILVERYFPKGLRRAYRRDWIRRYSAVARHDGHGAAVRQGLHEGLVGRARADGGRQTLDERTVEDVLGLRVQAEAVAAWKKRNNVHRVVIADFSKNIYATYAACLSAGLSVAAIIDHRAAFAGMTYRAALIRDYSAMADLSPDGVIISNTNPGQLAAREAQVRQVFGGPVLTLWQPRFMEPATARAA